jgi:TrmH family RNA methyltransferase
MRWKPYQRDSDVAYTFGVFPTIELLHQQPGQVREVLLHPDGTRNSGLEQLRALGVAAGVPVTVDAKLVERLSPKENTYAVGVYAKYALPLATDAPHVVLVNPSDMGNLGTILRTALAFGVSDLALIRPAADVFDPRCARASMGALFRARVAYYDDFEAYRAAFGGHHLYPFMTNGAVQLPAVRFQPLFALVFGSESAGLPDAFRMRGTSVTIPQSAAVDSLNLSAAVAVALYAAQMAQLVE